VRGEASGVGHCDGRARSVKQRRVQRAVAEQRRVGARGAEGGDEDRGGGRRLPVRGEASGEASCIGLCNDFTSQSFSPTSLVVFSHRG